MSLTNCNVTMLKSHIQKKVKCIWQLLCPFVVKILQICIWVIVFNTLTYLGNSYYSYFLTSSKEQHHLIDEKNLVLSISLAKLYVMIADSTVSRCFSSMNRLSHVIIHIHLFFIMFGFREASLRDWNADTGAQSVIHLFYIVIGVR